MTEFIVRPLVGATVATLRWLAAWTRAVVAGGVVLVAALVCSALVDLLFVPWLLSEGTYGTLFNVWIFVTILAVGVVGRAQLDR